MLTRKQSELLTYLTNHMERNDISPSFDEMRNALGLASKSGVHRLVSGLEERGFIKRLANRARAIKILKPLELKNNINQIVDSVPDTVELPLLGRIAAGTPIEALSDPSSYIGVPSNLIRKGEHFALEIVGDSYDRSGHLGGGYGNYPKG